MDKRFLFALFLVFLFIVNVPVSAVMAASSPAQTVTVVCTPPVCPTGGSFSCPPEGNGCPGGCGVVCVTPTTPVSAGEPLIIIGGIALCILVIGRRTG